MLVPQLRTSRRGHPLTRLVGSTLVAAVMMVVVFAPSATAAGSATSSFTYTSTSYRVVYRHDGVSPTIKVMQVGGLLTRTDLRTGESATAVIDGFARCSGGVCTFKMTWSHGGEHASYASSVSFVDGAYGERTDDCRTLLIVARCNGLLAGR